MPKMASRWVLFATFVVVAVVATTTTVGNVDAAVESCTVTRGGGAVTLSFETADDAAIIRRNGSWLVTLPAGSSSYVDADAPQGATYLVRTRTGAVVADTDCATGEQTPVTGCVAMLTGEAVQLSFEVAQGTTVVRRNDVWLVTLPPGSSSFADTTAPDGATYVLRTRPGGAVTDTVCTTGTGEDPLAEEPDLAQGCVSTRIGNSMRLDFAASPGGSVIRRDGRWLVSLPAGSTSYVDADAPQGATYLVRTRLAGVLTDVACAAQLDIDPVVDPATPDLGTDRVIHVSIDGLRADHVTPDLTPVLSMLMVDGASTLNARTDPGESRTLPNHTSQFTGRFVFGDGGHQVTFNEDDGTTVHETSGQYIPSVFDVVHDNGGTTILYAGKQKFDYLERSYADAGAADVTGSDHGTDKLDVYERTSPANAVAPFLADVIDAADSTTYGFFHIRLPDEIGHLSTWGSPEYVESVRESDRILGEVLQGLEDAGLLGSSSVIVTSDHGGPIGGLLHRNPSDAGNYTIPFIAWGAGVGEGLDLYAANAASGQYADPGTAQVGRDGAQPIRGHEAANLGLQLLELPALPAPSANANHSLVVN